MRLRWVVATLALAACGEPRDDSGSSPPQPVVVDDVRNLMWQARAGPEEMTQAEAVEHVRGLGFAGFSDWRLPTAKELRSLADPSGASTPPTAAESVDDFPALLPGYGPFDLPREGALWSCSLAPRAWSGDRRTIAYVMTIRDATIRSGTNARGFVLAVRDLRFVSREVPDAAGERVVEDTARRIMWQARPSSPPMPWEDAVAFAEDLRYGGYSDWRLPTKDELWSLADPSGGYRNPVDIPYDPAKAPPDQPLIPFYAAFDLPREGILFSSTLVPRHEDMPYVMRIPNAHTYNGGSREPRQGRPGYVLAVRDLRFERRG